MIDSNGMKYVKLCTCGGLVFAMFINGVWVEACERGGATASACSMPRIDLIHDHSRGPQGPPLTSSSYVLGTATGPTGPRPTLGAIPSAGPGVRPSAEHQFHVSARDTSTVPDVQLNG